MAAEPAGARLLASTWRCWRSCRLERAMWKIKCSSSKWQKKTSSVTKGLRKQNVQFVQYGSARRFAQRRVTYTHQNSNIRSARMQNRSMFSSRKRPVLECQRGTANNVHHIYFRSERCENLHALLRAEQGSKAGRKSPPVCKTECRNP